MSLKSVNSRQFDDNIEIGWAISIHFLSAFMLFDDGHVHAPYLDQTKTLLVIY